MKTEKQIKQRIGALRHLNKITSNVDIKVRCDNCASILEWVLEDEND